MWKFHNFAITQILREINFGECTSAKSAILTHLEVLNLDFYEFLHFLKAEIYHTRKAKAASGRLSLERGYNQTCHYYHNLRAAIQMLHAKFHQNPWCGFGEKCGQDNDIVQF